MYLHTRKRFLRAAFGCQIETELGSNQLTAVSRCQKQRKWTGMHHTLGKLCPLLLGCAFWQTHQPWSILVFQDTWLSLTVAVSQGIALEPGDSNLHLPSSVDYVSQIDSLLNSFCYVMQAQSQSVTAQLAWAGKLHSAERFPC